MYEPDTKHCQRIVDALNLKQAKTVGSPAVKENVTDVQRENAHGNPFKKIRHSGNRQVNTWVMRKLECTEAPWQTSVSHSSTESEIISLDAGLRLDGIPALDLWDLIVSVLGNTTQTTERPGRPEDLKGRPTC